MATHSVGMVNTHRVLLISVNSMYRNLLFFNVLCGIVHKPKVCTCTASFKHLSLHSHSQTYLLSKEKTNKHPQSLYVVDWKDQKPKEPIGR